MSKMTMKLLHEEEEKLPRKISYTAIVLDQSSHDKLKAVSPAGWDISKTSHHCTLNMGAWKGDRELIGQKFTMRVSGLAKDEKVAAVKVELPNGLSSFVKSGAPHVTVAVASPEVKPFLAGKLDFSKLENPDNLPEELSGTFKEVEEGDYSLAESLSTKGVILVERWQRLAGLIR